MTSIRKFLAAALSDGPSGSTPNIREILADTDSQIATSGAIGFLFAVTGPMAVLLTVSTAGELSQSDIASWIFAGYGISGIFSIVFSLYFRQPLAIGWTVPGAVLLGPALQHLTFPEVVGAYLVTGVLVTLIGITGLVRRAMAMIPMPIVMGMIAGVFMPFGLKIISAFGQALWIAVATIATFILISMIPRLKAVFPPVLGALFAGAIVTAGLGAFNFNQPVVFSFAEPQFYMPEFSIAAMIELVIPLTISVVAINNAQSFTILESSGYRSPQNLVTAACGLASLPMALLGSVPACTMGVVVGIINGVGDQRRRYIGSVICGVLFLLFGAFAPVATELALAMPVAFIGMLGGLALIGVLQTSFAAAFTGSFSLSALVTFLTTVSDVTLLNIGAPFWGLVFGCAVAWGLERNDNAARA